MLKKKKIAGVINAFKLSSLLIFDICTPLDSSISNGCHLIILWIKLYIQFSFFFCCNIPRPVGKERCTKKVPEHK